MLFSPAKKSQFAPLLPGVCFGMFRRPCAALAREAGRARIVV